MVYRKRHAGSGTGCWAFQWMTGCAHGSSYSAQRTARWHHRATNCSLVIIGLRTLVAEHCCCLPDVDGREPPIGQQGLPAGRQDASRNRSGVDRHRIWLAAAALICCAELTDHSEPQAMPELPELPLVQMGSVHHTPYMGPRCWWACYGSSSSSINSVICSLEEPSRSPKRRDQAALEASCLGPATRYQQLQPWPPIAPQAPEGSCADHLWYQPKLPVEAGSPGWPPPC
jgi:hypothetical protein